VFAARFAGRGCRESEQVASSSSQAGTYVTYPIEPSIWTLARAGVDWLERACMIGKSGWRAAMPVGACASNATDCARPNHKEQVLVRRCLFRHRQSLGPRFGRSSALCTQSRPRLQSQRAPSTGRKLLVVALAQRCSLRSLPPLQSVVAELCGDGYASQGRPRALPLPAARPCSS
jgi:hypothetical protein